jgi:hypothetical protein
MYSYKQAQSCQGSDLSARDDRVAGLLARQLGLPIPQIRHAVRPTLQTPEAPINQALAPINSDQARHLILIETDGAPGRY